MKYYKNLAQLQKAGLIQQTQQKIKKADVYNIKTIIYIYHIYIYIERELIWGWCINFFELLFGCPATNFGPLLRGQPHSPDVNHCVLHFQPEKVTGAPKFKKDRKRKVMFFIKIKICHLQLFLASWILNQNKLLQ